MFRMDERILLGKHLFTADDIIRFATKFDPQIFHLDEEAAKQSVLGGLCASGWHTASLWMRYNLAAMRSEPGPQFGPSPGIKNLKWIKPAYAGSTVTYYRTSKAIRPLASRPGWSMLTGLAEAENQDGELILSFETAVLVRMA
ncbi:MaoC family dehydratase [Limoniibacter endophyticus]|uniref:MaoC family dehydratase n=2 Tax=Limoniibacter endophyticus TaxID=1565040 RepID=A0A8J3DGV7_9HYPH|nr:MaoC family dehydratase [Limoniibacter endophyticus]GHC65626.1 MaoC family dehydratase [Limoniibacter endophyticus]